MLIWEPNQVKVIKVFKLSSHLASHPKPQALVLFQANGFYTGREMEAYYCCWNLEEARLSCVDFTQC